MRRKLGVILMTIATTLAGTSQAARQYENLKVALADWTARGSQPGLLFFAEGGEAIAKYSTPRASNGSGDDKFACVSSVAKPPAAARRLASPSRIASRSQRMTEPAIKHDRDELAATRRRESAPLRREIAQVARVIDAVGASREIEAALAHLPASERGQLRRAFHSYDWREANQKLQMKFAPPSPPAPVPGKKMSAVVKVRLPEISHDDARQGTERRERKMVWHFSAATSPADDAQPAAWPEPVDGDKSEAGDEAGLDCGDAPRR